MKFNIKKGLLCLCLLLLSTISVFAQGVAEDIVTLKNGSIIRGQVLEYNREGKVKIKIKGGSILVYNSAEVVKIEKSETEVNVKNGKVKRSLHVVKSKGFYNSFMFGTGICLSCGGQGFGGPSPEITLSYTAGYRFHNSFAVGLGLGLTGSSGNGYIPLVVNFRGNLLEDKSFNVYYNASIGYGFTIESLFFSQASGGVHALTGFGIQFPSTRKGHTALDLSFFCQEDRFGWSNELMLGPILRVGFVF